MFILTPYEYGSVEYYEYEKNTAKSNLDLVIAGAVECIPNYDLRGCQNDIISACEAVVVANDRYKRAEKNYNEAKAKEGKPNE